MSSKLSRWSVWHRGTHITDAIEYRSPDLKIQTTEYFAGHMDGSRIIDNGMQPLIASLKISGSNANNFIAIGFRPFLSTRFTIREGYIGTKENTGIEDEISGFITDIVHDPLPTKGRAEKSITISLSLSYYRRSVDNMEKILLIPGEGVRKINGVDSLNIISAMVYLSSLSDGLDSIDFKNLKFSDFIGKGFG